MHVTRGSLNRGAHGVLAADCDLLGTNMNDSLQGYVVPAAAASRSSKLPKSRDETIVSGLSRLVASAHGEFC
jgi:hypothetical protein